MFHRIQSHELDLLVTHCEEYKFYSCFICSFSHPLVFCSLMSPNNCSTLFKQRQCNNMNIIFNTVYHYYFSSSSQTQCFRNNQLFIFRCFWNVVHGRIQNMDDVQENSKVDCTTPSSECTLFSRVCLFPLTWKKVSHPYKVEKTH